MRGISFSKRLSGWFTIRGGGGEGRAGRGGEEMGGGGRGRVGSGPVFKNIISTTPAQEDPEAPSGLPGDHRLPFSLSL